MRKDGGREGRAKVAVAARRLMSLSKEVEGVEGADLVRSSSHPAQRLNADTKKHRLEIRLKSTVNDLRRTC